MDARQCQDYDYCLSYHYKYSDSKYEDTKQKVENEPGQRFNSQDTHHLRWQPGDLEKSERKREGESREDVEGMKQGYNSPKSQTTKIVSYWHENEMNASHQIQSQDTRLNRRYKKQI